MADNSTFRVSPYAPANETAYDLWYEKCNLDGAILASVAYGVHATLYFSAAAALWPQRRKMPQRTWVLLAYISAHFIMGSIAFGLNARFNELTFIDNRDFPGGPNGYFNANQDNWVQFVNYVLYIIIAWLQDALLIYRYYIFWGRNRWMLIIPCCTYTLSIVMGTMTLVQINTPDTTVWSNINFFTSFWAAELSTTIFLTGLIVGRLLWMRYRIHEALGPKHPTPYLGLAAMLAESGMMFSVGGLIFVISYAMNSPFQNMVLNMVGQMESIAPDLIILRVARGQGITHQELDHASMTLRNISNGSHNRKTDSSGVIRLSTFRAKSRQPDESLFTDTTLIRDIADSQPEPFRPSTSDADTKGVLSLSDGGHAA